MDWDLEFAVRPSSGLQIYNAIYKDQRIVYELGMQDTLSSYAGYTPSQANSVYFDAAWGMGTSLYELKAGSDCPYTAHFFDTEFYIEGAAKTTKNSVCVFEQDLAFPLHRHYDTDFVGELILIIILKVY
jgi:Cu2+-containing amine oxidase